MKKPINQLLDTLKEIKFKGATIYDINEIKNACYNYQNEVDSWVFDDILNEIIDFDLVLECIEYKAKQGDFWGIQNIVEGLEKDDYVKDNGDYFENITDDDIENRLDEIIEIAKDEKSKKLKD